MNLAASELGFGAEAEMRDRTQMQFIALLARQGAHRFTQMPKALLQAARQAGLNGVDVQQTKAGDRSSRWRIAGRTAEEVATTWEVEVSR